MKKSNMRRSTATTRILVLHDENSSISSLKDSLRPLEDRLYDKHNVEFIYLQGTHLGSRDGGDSKGLNRIKDGNSGEEGGDIDLPLKMRSLDLGRGCDNEDKDDDPSYAPRIWFDSETLIGLDASIYFLHQIWSREALVRPFSGILGFGQGGALAATLPFLRDELRFENLEFLIVCDGFVIDYGRSKLQSSMKSFLSEVFDVSTMSASNLPTLHIVSKPLHLQLTKYFEQSCRVIYETETIDGKLNRAGVFNKIGSWCVQRRKVSISAMCRKDHALLESEQHNLALLEHLAGNMFANAVAANPPKSLMAIIGKDAVGGWNGGKESKEDDGGGGAPCPKEFLLRKSERRMVKESTFNENEADSKIRDITQPPGRREN